MGWVGLDWMWWCLFIPCLVCILLNKWGGWEKDGKMGKEVCKSEAFFFLFEEERGGWESEWDLESVRVS